MEINSKMLQQSDMHIKWPHISNIILDLGISFDKKIKKYNLNIKNNF